MCDGHSTLLVDVDGELIAYWDDQIQDGYLLPTRQINRDLKRPFSKCLAHDILMYCIAQHSFCACSDRYILSTELAGKYTHNAIRPRGFTYSD